jgi:hypothetical protein
VVARSGPRGTTALGPATKGFMKFVEADELDGDGSNWWAPDTECVVGTLRAAGFKHFSLPVYQTPNRLVLVASKRSDSLPNLSAIA